MQEHDPILNQNEYIKKATSEKPFKSGKAEEDHKFSFLNSLYATDNDNFAVVTHSINLDKKDDISSLINSFSRGYYHQRNATVLSFAERLLSMLLMEYDYESDSMQMVNTAFCVFFYLAILVVANHFDNSSSMILRFLAESLFTLFLFMVIFGRYIKTKALHKYIHPVEHLADNKIISVKDKYKKQMEDYLNNNSPYTVINNYVCEDDKRFAFSYLASDTENRVFVFIDCNNRKIETTVIALSDGKICEYSYQEKYLDEAYNPSNIYFKNENGFDEIHELSRKIIKSSEVMFYENFYMFYHENANGDVHLAISDKSGVMNVFNFALYIDHKSGSVRKHSLIIKDRTMQKHKFIFNRRNISLDDIKIVKEFGAFHNQSI